MIKRWKEEIDSFLQLCDINKVRMIMVGGGAVNFHGYQRHSADVDFWIDIKEDNLNRLVKVFNEMGYKLDSFPEKVKNQKQNISVKFSPSDLNLELITKFSLTKTFEQAYDDSIIARIEDIVVLKWNVLTLNDLIDSKIRAHRPKDILDIQQLRKIHNLEN